MPVADCAGYTGILLWTDWRRQSLPAALNLRQWRTRWAGRLPGSIGARAFFNCRSLREICLKQVEEIGNTAFYGCGGLRRDRDGIGFSHSLRRVGERAFEGTCLLGAVGREGEGASEGTSLPVVYGNIVVSGAGCGGVPTEWR